MSYEIVPKTLVLELDAWCDKQKTAAAQNLTFKRRMSYICDGTPTPLTAEWQIYATRAAAVTSIGADRFMRSNKTIATDQDPCQWTKLSFPAKKKVKAPTVW